MDSYIRSGADSFYPVYYDLLTHGHWSLLVQYASSIQPTTYGPQDGYKGVIVVMKRAGLSLL